MAKNKTNESELPEDKVETKTQEQEKVSFFQKNWRNVAMLVALIFLWRFTGISIWFSVAFLAFFWGTTVMEGKPSSYAFLAKVLRGIFLVAMLNLVVITFLPLFNSTKPTSLAFVDQTLFSLTPKDVKVRAKNIFINKKRDAEKEFLIVYEDLLVDGRIEEAAEALISFEEEWKFKPDTEKQDKRFSLQSGNRSETKAQPQSQNQIPAPISMAMKDSVFHSGEYEIELVNGKTPFNIIVWFDNGSGNYTLESQNFNVFVQFPGEAPIKAIPGANFGHRIGPRFRLHGTDTKVKLVIT